MKWSIENTIITGFSFTLGLLGIVTGLFYWNTNQLIRNGEWKEHTYVVIKEVESLLSQIKDIETAKRDFLITGEESYIATYKNSLKELDEKLEKLQELTVDNPHQKKRLQELKFLITKIINISQENINLRKSKDFDIGKNLLITMKNKDIIYEIRYLINGIKTEEDLLLIKRSQAESDSIKQTNYLIYLSIFLATLLIPIAGIIIFQDTKERKKIEKYLRKSEARFSGILDIAQEAIICINTKQDITLFNKGAEKLFDCSSQQIIGRSLSLIFPERLKENYYNNINNFVNDNINVFSAVENFGEIKVKGKSSSKEFSVQASISKIQVDQENILTLILRDISERIETEEQLAEANQKLQEWVNSLEEYNQELNQLSNISELLQSCLSFEEIYQVISQLIPSLFPHISGSVYILSESKNLLENVVSWSDQDSKQIFTPLQCWALRLSKPYIIEDFENQLVCEHLLDDSDTEHYCIPMMNHGEVLGLLHLSSKIKGQFTNKSKNLLTRSLSEHIALALANLKLRHKLKNQSICDALTGLFNRRYLEESFQIEIEQAEIHHQSLGVIMFDVDHFKKFNDTFGHEAGDILLKELGLFIKNSMRKGDIACRYGGEEFTILLPNTSLKMAQEIAEKLRQEIKHLNLNYHRQLLGQISISLGLAIFPVHGLTKDDLIQAADAALYRSKKEGRDRVSVAS